MGITIGVAALIIVLSVFNGFGSLVTNIMVSFDPHVKIAVAGEKGFDKLDSVEGILRGSDKLSSYTKFAEGKVIIANKRNYEIINLKGIEEKPENGRWGAASKLISGKFDLGKGKQDKIIIGIPLALRLAVRIGDTVTVTSAYNIEKTIASLAIPQTRKFIIAGIFESDNRDYDLTSALSSLDSAQKLFGLKNRFTGYEIRLRDFKEAENFKEDLNKKINPDLFSVSTWFDLHKQLYTVMQIERWAAYILLCLIIAVATFNIFASLTMTVIEKKKDIGILRSMGFKKASIMRVFMFEGILVGLIGTVIGILIGLGICYLQIEYNFYPLDSSKYIINALPVEVRVADIIAISGMAMFLVFMASLYPAKRAANAVVIESIKYE